jgi:hypothetical protein
MHHNHTEMTTRKVRLLCNGVATPSHRASPKAFEFCSGLVDLVVGVGHHRGGGHRLTLVGGRFVGRLAKNALNHYFDRCQPAVSSI